MDLSALDALLRGNRRGVVLTFVHLEKTFLSVRPKTKGFDNVVLLGDIYVLMLKKDFELFLSEVLDVWVVDQHGEVAVDIA